MKVRLMVLVSLFLLPACATSRMVYTRGNSSDPNAPINETRGGMVSYLNDGARSILEERRKDAYKKMHDFCQGNYEIMKESLGSDGSFSLTTPGPAGYMTNSYSDTYRYLEFNCVAGNYTK